MAYTDKPAVRGPRAMPPGYPEDDYPEDEDTFFVERPGKKEKKVRTPEEKKAHKEKKQLKKAKKADKKRTAELSEKNKAYDSNSKEWRKNVKIQDDQYVPEGRIKPKDDARYKEQGIVIRYPDMVKATKPKEDGSPGVCAGIRIDSRRGQKKCVQKMRAEYRKEHAVVYTSACAGVTGYFAKKRCIKKYNRGL